MTEFNKNERDLVAEQPGLGLSLIGLFLAFFMGLAIRASVSPDRVQEHLLRATENIHKDLKFSFKKAYVSFADGWLPDLSVVVQDVKIESSKSCWLSPLVEVSEIRLPLSMKHLLRGQILIHEVLADEVNLSLRTEQSPCAAEIEDTGTKPPSPPPTQESLKVGASAFNQKINVSDFQNVSRKNPIDTLKIGSLKIHYLPMTFTSFYLQDFEALLKSEEPRWLQVSGRMVMTGDAYRGESDSQADLKLDAIEGESFKGEARGVWREGHYRIQLAVNLKNQLSELQAEASHLPVSQILPLLKKYRWVESDFNGKKAWFSGNLKMQGALEKLKETPLRLEKLKLEGDLGEISLHQAQIQSLSPLRFDPLEFELRGLNIKELLVFLDRPHPSPALGDLGIFTGTARFVNPEHVVLRGDYSGLEFIFSNRGVRQSQVLSLVSGELDLNQTHWDISIDRIKPAEGVFEGKVHLKADKNFRDLDLEAKIVELGLAPKVQSLMTGGGSLGALSGQLRTRLKSAQIADLQGQIKWDHLMIEGVRLNRPKVTLQSKGDEIDMNFSAQDLDLDQHSMVSQWLQPVWQDLSSEMSSFKNPSVQIRTRKFQTLTWRDFQLQSSMGGIRSQGQWNESAELSGEIRLLGPKAKNWELSGTRNQPKIRARNL